MNHKKELLRSLWVNAKRSIGDTHGVEKLAQTQLPTSETGTDLGNALEERPWVTPQNPNPFKGLGFIGLGFRV